MAYVDIDGLEAVIPESVLIQLTDDAGSGVLDAAVVQSAIDDAAEEINGWIGRRFKLPLSTAPSILAKFNADIAVYNLYGRRSGDVPEKWRNRYKDAVKFLEAVSDGRVTLGVQPGPDAPTAGSSAGIKTSARTKIFSETELDKF